jgi:hypothetical protein
MTIFIEVNYFVLPFCLDRIWFDRWIRCSDSSFVIATVCHRGVFGRKLGNGPDITEMVMVFVPPFLNAYNVRNIFQDRRELCA